MAIQVKELKDSRSIEEYIDRFAQLVGVRIPLEYIRRGTVYGCYNRSGDLVGGYALVTTPPYRGVVFLPDDIRKNHWFFRSISLDNVLEVNGVWLERNVRLSIMDCYTFWREVIHSMGATHKRYILVWYNSLNKHLCRFYSRVSMELIYSGRSAPNGNQVTHPEICVAYTTRWKLYWSLVRHLPRVWRIRFTRLRRSLISGQATGPSRERPGDRERSR